MSAEHPQNYGWRALMELNFCGQWVLICLKFCGQWALIIHNFEANVFSLADEWPLATKSWTMRAHWPQNHGPWVLIGLKNEANEHSLSIILRTMSTHQRSFSHDYHHWPLTVRGHLEWVRIMSTNDWWKFCVPRSTTAWDFRWHRSSNHSSCTYWQHRYPLNWGSKNWGF